MLSYFDRIEAGLNPDLDNIISNYVQSVFSFLPPKNSTLPEFTEITVQINGTNLTPDGKNQNIFQAIKRNK